METGSDSPMTDFKVPSLPFKAPTSKAETVKPDSDSNDLKVPELPSNEETKEDTKEETAVVPEAPLETPAAQVTTATPASPAVQYEEPSWGGTPPSEKHYSLEILKAGIIVDNIKLAGKSFFTVGR